MQSLLADITKEHVWKEVVGEDDNGNPSVPCPLTYSEEDMVKQRMEYAMWETDVGRNTRVLDEIGVYLAGIGQCLLVIMMKSSGGSLPQSSSFWSENQETNKRERCGRRSGQRILGEISSSPRVSVEYRL